MGSGNTKSCVGVAIRDKLESVSEKEPFRVLLLGTSDSGKSTIRKQMKHIFAGGFNDAERKKAQAYIHLNTMECIQNLLCYCREKKIDFDDEELQESADTLNSGVLFLDKESLGRCITAVWSNAKFKETAKQVVLEGPVRIYDSALYWFGRIDETFKFGYVPNDADMLRMRSSSSGITETLFQTPTKLCVNLLDVGGLRGERLAWNKCLKEGVGAIFYVVSLSDYDQTLHEDPLRNRLAESLKVFQSITKNFPNDMPVVLFLNKEDNFKEKVVKVDIGKFHPDYKDGLSYEKGLAYITKLFTDAHTESRKDCPLQMCVHVTTALATNDIKDAWNKVQLVLEQSKQDADMK